MMMITGNLNAVCQLELINTIIILFPRFISLFIIIIISVIFIIFTIIIKCYDHYY